MELQLVQNKIYQIRGHKFLLDADLAILYGTNTKTLKQAVRRNKRRFREDFMFELNKAEHESLRSQIVTLEIGRGKYSKYLPYAFTEQGVAMLSSILKSNKAIDVNIAIMRAFVVLRQHLSDYNDLKQEIGKLEREMKRKFKDIDQALRYLRNPKSKPIEIGFKQKGRVK